jgi:hypothetical protein
LVLLLPTLLSRCLYRFPIVACNASAGPQLAALIAWKLDFSVSSGYKSRRLERTNSWFFIITIHCCTYAAIVLDNKPAGKLNVDRLRRVDLHKDSWFNLVCALVLWHDVKAILIESEPDLHYSMRICEVVHEFETKYKMTYLNFRGLLEPGDPLKLSDEQFCHLYHVHNQANLPCYKRKRPSHSI